MVANFHTHTTFCDGDNTPEQIVKAAINKGFLAIGFSGHGYTDFDLRYCMQNTDEYINEIARLKEKYKNDIHIYLGIEEDAFCLADRGRFDYIIGSSHYFCIDNQYYPIDSDYDYFKKCLEAFDNDVIRLADTYYSCFCDYIFARKPDVIGHFDLITKFDEQYSSLFLQNDDYNKIAEKYIEKASGSGCVFEVNTGAVAKKMRTSPYPAANLLRVLKKSGARVILSSDSHNVDTLDFGFDDTKKYLRDIGFTELYTIDNGGFVKYNI